jgi:glucosamine--fructose-6-phosphate aminotransferase (isomerizing)
MTQFKTQMQLEAEEAPSRVRELLTTDHDLYRALGQRLRKLDPSLVGTIARGSSDHAATYASYLIPQCTGRLVASIPPSIVTVLDAPLRMSGQVVLALSQSGGSPDLLKALERCRRGGAFTAALINAPDSPLARGAEISLAQHAGPEKSITATKSVLCTLTGIARITAEWSEDRVFLRSLEALPEALSLAAQAGALLDEGLLRGIGHAFIISRGLGHGAALELALKLKETSGIHAEAFSTAEVRHGPREIVDKEFLVIALALPGSGEADVLAASAELKAQGARVLLLGRSGLGETFTLPALPDNRLAPLVALQLLYPWIARCAVSLGRNPDKPKTLADKVIKTV